MEKSMFCCRHQDQEPGVRGQPDWGPDGPLCAAWRARHHVHHAQGNKGNNLQKSVVPCSLQWEKRWCSKKCVKIESVEYRVSGHVFVSCRRVTTRFNMRRSRRTSATFSGFGLTGGFFPHIRHEDWQKLFLYWKTNYLLCVKKYF